MRLRCFSPYNRFPNHNEVYNRPYLPCYNDFHVKDKYIEKNAIALMTEPRPLMVSVYNWLEQNSDKFKMIFTHDSILLETLPNAHPILKGGVWAWSERPKTKGISFCSADKEMCHIHRMRKILAYSLENTIDCMGTFNGGAQVSTLDIYADYKFSVAIENYKDDIWFTEKICNAFANKCVPIYYGARNIGKYFNVDGIIQVQNLYEIPDIVDSLLENLDEEYEKRKEAIEDNYIRVKQFSSFEDWFFRTWDDALEGLYKGTIKGDEDFLNRGKV